MIRLYPIPFRLLEGDQQFKKWEWIQADIMPASKDNRPESHKIDVDTIVRTGQIIDTKDYWEARKRWIEPHVVSCYTLLEQRRQISGETLGIIHPTNLHIEIAPIESPEWTEEEKMKLLQEGLFDSPEAKSRPPLRKVPYRFYYTYECQLPNSETETCRHMITDWEVSMLYWNCFQRYGKQWEQEFRKKLEDEFAQKDLYFLMGTVHRFPDQWLIVGLFYPPKRPDTLGQQLEFEL